MNAVSPATADVVVVGLGAVGSATLHRLALAGVRAVGIDRHDPPHDWGSTHGESRITRLAIAEGAAYVPLARRSQAIWRELEAETGERLFEQCGLLIVAEGEGAPSHGQANFLQSTLDVARAEGVPHEELDAAEIVRRYPQFLLRGMERGFFEPSAGALHVERCVDVQLRLARARGAVTRTGETVLSVSPNGSGVSVVTDRGRIEAGRVVLTAGAWLPGMAGGVLAQVAAVHRQVFLWHAVDEPALYQPAVCPAFIWFHGATEEDYLYGIPLMDGSTSIKAGTERYPGHVHPDQVDRVVSAAEAAEIYRRHIAGRLRGVSDRLTKASTCLYTVTPDAGFIVDSVGGDGRVLVASACSGHGFKHSPAMGERLAAMVTAGAAAEPVFAMSRFAGQMPAA